MKRLVVVLSLVVAAGCFPRPVHQPEPEKQSTEKAALPLPKQPSRSTTPHRTMPNEEAMTLWDYVLQYDKSDKDRFVSVIGWVKHIDDDKNLMTLWDKQKIPTHLNCQLLKTDRWKLAHVEKNTLVRIHGLVRDRGTLVECAAITRNKDSFDCLDVYNENYPGEIVIKRTGENLSLERERIKANTAIRKAEIESNERLEAARLEAKRAEAEAKKAEADREKEQFLAKEEARKEEQARRKKEREEEQARLKKEREEEELRKPIRLEIDSVWRRGKALEGRIVIVSGTATCKVFPRGNASYSFVNEVGTTLIYAQQEKGTKKYHNQKVKVEVKGTVKMVRGTVNLIDSTVTFKEEE